MIKLLLKSKTLKQNDKVVKLQFKCQGHNDACKWKGHDSSNNVSKYEINRLTNEKVIRGKQNFNTNCLWRQPASQDGFTNL